MPCRPFTPRIVEDVKMQVQRLCVGQQVLCRIREREQCHGEHPDTSRRILLKDAFAWKDVLVTATSITVTRDSFYDYYKR